MVRWLDPRPLLTRSVSAAISGLFGSEADRREMQAALSAPADLDYSGAEELWLDYAADTGDGFNSTYAVASLLARPGLELAGGGTPGELPRGRILVLGGDAVYPAASEDVYRDRFAGPFRAALPCAPEDEAPHLFAIPGNHDWYDGLTGFLRLFCQGRWVGGWRTRQTRSYFALRLPHRWWLLAIDISFDRFIDRPQLEYFRGLAGEQMRPGDRVILCTAKPSWVHAGMAGDESYKRGEEARRNLAYFERTVVAPTGARLVLTLSGDLHHYARYANPSRSRMMVTAGAGGAYLYPTHGLPQRVSWSSPAGGEEDFDLVRAYPPTDRSRRLRLGVLLSPFRNPGFWAAVGLVHVALIWMVQFGLRRPGVPVAQAFHRAGFSRIVLATLRFSPSLAVALVVVAAFVAFADARGWRRILLGGVHGLVQAGIPLAMAWALGRAPLDGAPFLALLLGTVAVGGGFASASVMGLYLFVANALFGRHPNEAFAAQHIQDWDCFLRMRLDREGRLTVYPVAIQRVPRRWRLVPEGNPGAPWFEPVDAALAPRLIEEPFTLS